MVEDDLVYVVHYMCEGKISKTKFYTSEKSFKAQAKNRDSWCMNNKFTVEGYIISGIKRKINFNL